MPYKTPATSESGRELQKEGIWKDLRREFSVADQYIYLNHAAICPLPKRAAAAIARCAQDFCDKGIVCNRDYLAAAEATRELAARLIGATAKNIAFVKIPRKESCWQRTGFGGRRVTMS